jgi:hypothetical protein
VFDFLRPSTSLFRHLVFDMTGHVTLQVISTTENFGTRDAEIVTIVFIAVL